MGEHLETSADNIRYNGTGRVYVGTVAGSSLRDLGELDGFNFNMTVSTDKLKTTRSADRATILEKETERDAALSFGLQEQTEQNLLLALMGSSVSADDQSASYVSDTSVALVSDEYVDLGHVNVFVTQLTGTITGSLDCGDSLTGDTSTATGDIAWTESGLVELVNVSGTFVSGEKVELDDSNYITVTGVTEAEDVVVVDSAVGSGTPTTRYVQGTDYSLDADYGYLRLLSDGSITSPAYVSYDYEAVTVNYFYGMSAATVQKKVVMVTDQDDNGIRNRITFHKVNVKMNGDWSLIGDGPATIPIEGTVVKDTSQSSGQEYFKIETMD
jgi:hypothetical protein